MTHDAAVAEAHRKAKKIALMTTSFVVAPVLVYAAIASSYGGNWWSLLLSPLCAIGAVGVAALTKYAYGDTVMESDEVGLVFLSWGLMVIMAAMVIALVVLVFTIPFM